MTGANLATVSSGRVVVVGAGLVVGTLVVAVVGLVDRAAVGTALGGVALCAWPLLAAPVPGL